MSILPGLDWLFSSSPKECPTEAEGYVNMALDEALLHHAIRPTLRLYRWHSEWDSYGYFIKHDSLPARHNPVVRRWTGGGLVHHKLVTELTYALAIPRKVPFYEIRPRDSYSVIHSAVQRALRDCGVEVELASPKASTKTNGPCFVCPVPADLVQARTGRKIAGAGQRRSRMGLLHQGSIQLDIPVPDRLPEAIVYQLGGLHSTFHERPPESIQQTALKLIKDRYSSPEWLRDRPPWTTSRTT